MAGFHSGYEVEFVRTDPERARAARPSRTRQPTLVVRIRAGWVQFRASVASGAPLRPNYIKLCLLL